MAFTPDGQQKTAIETMHTSVVLTAGAGCGKTGTLGGKFIAAIESGIEPGAIAVLTFTKKAAAELRHRIREECIEKARISGNSEINWELIAFCIDGVIISTYHSFYEELCREYAEELGIDPEFKLIDQRIAQGLLVQAARMAVKNRLATDDDNVIEFAARHRLETLVKELCILVSKIEEGRLTDLSRTSPEEWVERWEKLAESAAGAALDKYLSILNGITKYERKGLNKNQREKMAELDDIIVQYVNSNPVLLIEMVHSTIGKLNPSDPVLKELFIEYKRIRADESFSLLQSDSELLNLAARETTLLSALAIDTKAFYQQAKMARRVVDFDDLMELAERLTEMSQKAKGGVNNRFRLLLIDEFQDTDSRQARILRNLTGEEFNNGRLFVVGDSRQAIYRFRGARPEELDELQNAVSPAGRQYLINNYRSRRQIIRFVNHLERILYSGMKPLEPGLTHEKAIEASSPAVTFHWTLTQKKNKESAEFHEVAESNLDVRTEARLLAEYIKKLTEKKFEVGARKNEMRPVQPGDIVFLSRNRTHWSIYEKALRKVHLEPYLETDSGLFSRQEIRDLVNLLALVENPTNDLLLAAVLRGPFGAITDETLFWLAEKEHGIALSEAFWRMDFADFDEVSADQADALDGLRALLRSLAQAKTLLAPSRVVEMALERTAYEQIIREISFREKDNRALQNLDVLVNDARTFDQDPDFGWQAMIRQWLADMEGGKVNEAVVEPPRDRIRFLTIHSAKGLQFPVVVMVGLNAAERNDTSSWIIHPEQGLVTKSRTIDSDEYGGGKNHIAWQLAKSANKVGESKEIDNLLYVAATRAEDHLIICAPFKVEDQNDDLIARGELLKRVELAFDLRSGKPRNDIGDNQLLLVQVLMIDYTAFTVEN